MPDVKEVYEMVTKQTPPKPASWDRQRTRQVRAARNRKAGAIAVAAAIGAIVVAVVWGGFASSDRVPSSQPSNPVPGPETTAMVGTVTFDGSSCSIDITAERIGPGAVVFDVINASDRRVMFDSWRIEEGYTFAEFEAAVAQVRRLAETGKEYPADGLFPDQETEVTYLRSDALPAGNSEIIASTMSPAGQYAIVCLQRYEGAHASLRGFEPFGIAGPIAVG